MIELKEGFIYQGKERFILCPEKREKRYMSSLKLRKEYIKPLKSPQMALVFFIGKKRIVRREWFRTISI